MAEEWPGPKQMLRYCEGTKYLFSNIMPDKFKAFSDSGLTVEAWVVPWMKTMFTTKLALPKSLLFFDYWLLCGDISFFRLALVALHRTVGSNSRIEDFNQEQALDKVSIGDVMDNLSLSHQDFVTMLTKHSLN